MPLNYRRCATSPTPTVGSRTTSSSRRRSSASAITRCSPRFPIEHWRIKHQRILRGATERCEEERFLRANGSDNILRWEVRPWYLAADRIGGIMMLTEEITERKKLQDELWRLAKLDSLTSLPNRLLFNERLRELIEAAEGLLGA